MCWFRNLFRKSPKCNTKTQSVTPFHSIFSNTTKIEEIEKMDSKYVVAFYPETLQNLIRIRWLFTKLEKPNQKYFKNDEESTAEFFRRIAGLVYTLLFCLSKGWRIILEKGEKNSKNYQLKYLSILKK